MEGLYYLLKSTNFWNAIIGGLFTVIVFLITESEPITLTVSGLFIIRGTAKGFQDYAQARSIKETNPAQKKE